MTDKLINSIKSGITLLLLLWGNLGYAQQDSQFTQYMYNTVSINPAYAGNRGVLSLNGIYRNQWAGMEGAPKTISFSLNSPMGVKGVGLGVGFFNDKIGPVQESNIAADFSYTIPVSGYTRLSFGLKGGLNFFDVDVNKLGAYNPGDSNLFSTSLRSPVVGIGAYLHSKEWYLGLSSPNILETDHFDEVAVSTATEKAHIYFLGGYVFTLNPNLKLKPAFMTKAAYGTPLSVDFSANFLFYDKFTFGAAYRYNVAVSALAGFQISDVIMLGYAFDFDTTEVGRFNSGSHEVFLRFELGTRTRTSINPRFF